MCLEVSCFPIPVEFFLLIFQVFLVSGCKLTIFSTLNFFFNAIKIFHLLELCSTGQKYIYTGSHNSCVYIYDLVCDTRILVSAFDSKPELRDYDFEFNAYVTSLWLQACANLEFSLFRFHVW